MIIWCVLYVEQNAILKNNIMNIEAVIEYLNYTYNQQTVSEEGTIRIPKIEKLDDAIISYWDWGAIVNIGKFIYFVEEDDLIWQYKGMRCHIDSINSIQKAISKLKDFAKKYHPNGRI